MSQPSAQLDLSFFLLIRIIYIDGHSYLVNIPISRAALPIPTLDSLASHNYNAGEPVEALTTTLDLVSEHRDLIKHTFASKSRPVRIEVNARKGRRAVCVLYGDGMKYEVFDLDARVDGDEEQEEG